MNTLPPGAIAAGAQLAREVLTYLKNLGQKEAAKLSVDIEYGFRKFLERNYRQYSKIKTLLNSGAPVSLEATFESPHLKIDDKIFNEDDFLGLLERDRFFIITGLGGSGKSVFLKHLFIRYYNEARERIPFFVELRNVPKNLSLIQYLHQLLKSVCPQFDTDLFEYALRTGKFLFLLDGFDEVDYDIRKGMAQEIIDLTYSFGDNLVVTTSRPDEIFQSWNEFFVAEMQGFTRNQALSLVKKLKYDKTTKSDFLKLIKDGGLYSTHGSYLSNPLLCNIMLLTFGQGAEIPQKMHLFFGQTFDVLFYRHDATKGTAFRRKFQTTFSVDDFRATLAAFSAFSYMDHGPSMKRAPALDSANKAMKYCRSNEKAEDFLTDLCSSISMLIKEGDNYSYVHRSFQEYFFAVFLASRDLDDWGNVVEQIVKKKPNDSVVQLLSDINRDRFEQEFLAPRISSLASDLRAIDVDKNPAKAFLLFYLDMSVSKSADSRNSISWTVGRNDDFPKWYYLARFIRSDDAYERLRAFDWHSHVIAHNKNHTHNKSTQTVTLRDITNEAFYGTPMIVYLQGLKDDALALDESLKNSAQTKQKLFSNVLFGTKANRTRNTKTKRDRT
ncbi:NACHT domain-containing protein [Agrobacterium tumefaciens]|uniref:NACHT domain-containing protein n=1 Tax=Agrobacterium tumefaciens TaxID=358 RepID=UPI001ADA09E5|nr:NACHT domain-containing protein [Agrobacterium tumefaciens]QTK79787.1 NACHT domain-containing protein [Agrobacterium tumefaciens]